MKEKRSTDESGRLRTSKKQKFKKEGPIFWDDKPDPIYIPRKRKKN